MEEFSRSCLGFSSSIWELKYSEAEEKEEEKGGNMHDFCFTIPYGFAVLLGGMIGYLRKGSTMSLLGGSGTGLLLLLAGYQSLQAYEKGTNSWPSLVLETVVSLVLTVVMGQRYQLTGKFMPAGMVLALGGVMTLFYFYKLATGGNKITKKVT